MVSLTTTTKITFDNAEYLDSDSKYSSTIIDLQFQVEIW